MGIRSRLDQNEKNAAACEALVNVIEQVKGSPSKIQDALKLLVKNGRSFIADPNNKERLEKALSALMKEHFEGTSKFLDNCIVYWKKNGLPGSENIILHRQE